MFNNIQLPDLGLGIFIIVLWEAFWKLIALWRAAKKGDLVWFIAIFIINLFGLIPIFYLWRTKQLQPALRDFQTFFTSKLKKN